MKLLKSLLFFVTLTSTIFFAADVWACADSCATEADACSIFICMDCPQCQDNYSDWKNAYGSLGTKTNNKISYYETTTDENAPQPPLATSSGASSSSSSGGKENLKGEHVGDKDQEQDCSLETMKNKYLPDNGMTIDDCWYCKVVTIMTNAFLAAAVNALSVCIELGSLILKLGFAIWLAYYILQQVSSIAPIKLGGMLEEILTMGFKVALASLVIKYAQDTLASLLVNPIMLTGIDYGGRILDGILKLSSAGGG